MNLIHQLLLQGCFNLIDQTTTYNTTGMYVGYLPPTNCCSKDCHFSYNKCSSYKDLCDIYVHVYIAGANVTKGFTDLYKIYKVNEIYKTNFDAKTEATHYNIAEILYATTTSTASDSVNERGSITISENNRNINFVIPSLGYSNNGWAFPEKNTINKNFYQGNYSNHDQIETGTYQIVIQNPFTCSGVVNPNSKTDISDI